MNIGAISSSQVYSTSSSSTSSQNALSLEQEEAISSILSNYDASSLSQSDASEIVAAFQDAGIEPSKQLADSMDSLGFSAQEVGSLAGVGPSGGMAQGGMPPPPPPQEEQSTIATLLDELLQNEEDDDTTTAYENVLDYTSRIINLNDEARTSVMELFEEYSQENTELSKEDASKVVANSLKQILNDSENYNSFSFFA